MSHYHLTIIVEAPNEREALDTAAREIVNTSLRNIVTIEKNHRHKLECDPNHPNYIEE